MNLYGIESPGLTSSLVIAEDLCGKLALGLADDVSLLSTGRIVFSGSASEFQAQQDTRQAHLGVG